MKTSLGQISFRVMMANFAAAIIDTRPPTQIISREGDPYLERWMIARKAVVPTLVENFAAGVGDGRHDLTPLASELENLFIHRYVRGDREDLHCHPWPNVTLVLNGHLTERTPDGLRRLLPGDIVIRRAEDIHAIEGVMRGTITLFATGRKEREWGFHTRDGFVHHREYNGRVPA